MASSLKNVDLKEGDRVEWPNDASFNPKYRGTVRLTSPAYGVAIVDWDEDARPGKAPAGLVAYNGMIKINTEENK